MSAKNEATATTDTHRKPTMFEAVSSIVFLFAAFGIGARLGINSVITMLIISGYAMIIAKRCGYTWKEMETAHARKLRKAVPALTIILAVGALLAGFMYSGTLPMLIYYGIQVISPQWLALSAFILCAVFSTATGTSNGSVTTAGVAMMGLALAMENVNIGLVAGAIFCGAMFGDKLSPLSDTTILASLITGNDVFDHIKHMAKTVIPAACITAGIYIVIAMRAPTAAGEVAISGASQELMTALDGIYKWNIVLLLPIVFVLWGAYTKKPSFLVMLGAAFIAVLLGIFYQGFPLTQGINSLYTGFTTSMIASARPDVQVSALPRAVTTLLHRGGINVMLRPFITCYFCFYFASISEMSGVLELMINKMYAFVKRAGGLIIASGVSVMLLNAIGGSSSIGILIGGELFGEKYKEMGMHSLNLSRTLEDFGTGTTGFFPWTSSGVLYASVLGVGSMTFVTNAFMIWIVIAIAIFYGYTGICIRKLTDAEIKADAAASAEA